MANIGYEITRRRRAAGRTQKELAREAGMAQPNLSNIEKGKQDITVSTLKRIAYVLGVSIQDFFAEEKPADDRAQGQAISFSREGIERLARAIVSGAHQKLQPTEQKVARLYERLMPTHRVSRISKKKLYADWLLLKTLIGESGIKTLHARVRDATQRLHETTRD